MTVAGESMKGSIERVTPRRSAMARSSLSISATMRLRAASSGARASIVNATSPAITLTAPGATFAAPTVATVSSRREPMPSTAAIISAAAASASRRIAIGTVPACPARPRRSRARGRG